MIAGAVLTAGAFAATGHAAAFGPPVKDCSALKGAKRTECVKNNTMIKRVFNQVKNGRYVGVTLGGTSIDATFCANGKWSVIAQTPGFQPLTFSGGRWRLAHAWLSRNGRNLAATAHGLSRNIHTRVHLRLRGTAWVFAYGNFVTTAEAVTRTRAGAACAAL